MPDNNEKSGNSESSPVFGNTKFTDVIENPYYGMDDQEGNESSVRLKIVENSHYNEAD